EFSVGSASNRRAVLTWSEWVGELVLQRFPVVTLWISPVFGPFAGLVGSPKVRPAFRRKPFCLNAPPGSDFGMVAGREYLRDRLALENRGARVLRVFEQTVSKTFLGGGGLFAHDAGQEPHAGVQQRERGNLAAGEHKIA